MHPHLIFRFLVRNIACGPSLIESPGPLNGFSRLPAQVSGTEIIPCCTTLDTCSKLEGLQLMQRDSLMLDYPWPIDDWTSIKQPIRAQGGKVVYQKGCEQKEAKRRTSDGKTCTARWFFIWIISVCDTIMAGFELPHAIEKIPREVLRGCW